MSQNNSYVIIASYGNAPLSFFFILFQHLRFVFFVSGWQQMAEPWVKIHGLQHDRQIFHLENKI